MVLSPFELKKKDSSLQKDLNCLLLAEKKKKKKEKKEKSLFLSWTLCTVRNGNLFMPIQQGGQMWHKNMKIYSVLS